MEARFPPAQLPLGKDHALCRRSWKQIVRSLFADRQPTIRTRPQRRRPELEALEDRVTPAVIVTFRAGVLSVTGDNAANVITLERRADARLAVTSTNSQVFFLDRAVPTMNNVASIIIRAGSGNDVVRTIERGGSLPGLTILGDAGNDTLSGASGNDNLNGDQLFNPANPGGNDTLTGGLGGDSFFFGQPFTGATPQLFGADTVTDFGNGADTVKLVAGLSVRSGLGTTTVVIWNGTTNFGTIFASNGHLWVAGDFT